MNISLSSCRKDFSYLLSLSDGKWKKNADICLHFCKKKMCIRRRVKHPFYRGGGGSTNADFVVFLMRIGSLLTWLCESSNHLQPWFWQLFDHNQYNNVENFTQQSASWSSSKSWHQNCNKVSSHLLYVPHQLWRNELALSLISGVRSAHTVSGCSSKPLPHQPGFWPQWAKILS